MTTALLPTDGPPPVAADTYVLADGLLDAVHDHVLRLVGDRAAARAVVTDLALRTAARLEDGDQAPTLPGLVRAAHARLATEACQAPGPDLVTQLAGPMGTTGRVLVRAMTIPGPREAALLDLTARHGLELRAAAELLGIDRTAAARLHTNALRQVRAHLADSGAGLDVDVPTALAGLPVVPAPAEVHDLLPARSARRSRSRPVPGGAAWLATALVAVLTVGALAMGLAEIVEHDDGVPIAQAAEVSEGPAVRQLTDAGSDGSDRQVEQLVVRAPADQTSETTGTPTDRDETPAAPEADADAEATPEQPEESDPSPAPEDEEPETEQPSPEPSPEPDNPLGNLLPTGP